MKSYKWGLFLGLFLTLSSLSSLAEKEVIQEGLVTGELDNGIPVFILDNPTSSVKSLKLFFKGNSQFSQVGKEGLEKLTLTLLSHGSESWTWEEVQNLLYQKSSSVGPLGDNFDYSGFSLNTLDKYYPEIYSLFVDELLNPSWSEDEFKKVQDSMLMARTQRQADPYSLASSVLSDQFFGSHPYQNDTDGTIKSLSGLTLDDVKEHYAKALVADRMLFVAVGNYEADELVEQLNRDFGSLKMTGIDVSPVEILEPLETGGTLVEPFFDSPGLAYVRGNFTLPELSAHDMATMDLALSLLDDILFQVVRTENSACYSIWSNLYSFEANYGCFGVYKTQVPYEVDELILESVSILASGQCLSTTPKEGELYVSIEEALEFYKAQFVTNYFSDQQTSSSVATQIGESYIYEGDPMAYRSSSQEWGSVTAKEIVDVVNMYLVDQPILWIVLGGEDIIAQ